MSQCPNRVQLRGGLSAIVSGPSFLPCGMALFGYILGTGQKPGDPHMWHAGGEWAYDKRTHELDIPRVQVESIMRESATK